MACGEKEKKRRRRHSLKKSGRGGYFFVLLVSLFFAAGVKNSLFFEERSVQQFSNCTAFPRVKKADHPSHPFLGGNKTPNS